MTDPAPAPDLRAIGWPDTPALREAAGPARVARVIGQHRSAYVVADGPVHEWRVQPPAPWTRPALRPRAARRGRATGSTLEPDGKHIAPVLPRYALLKRGRRRRALQGRSRSPRTSTRSWWSSGLDRDFNPRRIERYLLLVQASGAAPVLVLTKADQCDIVDDVLDTLAEIIEAGVPVHPVNAKDAASLAVLHPYLGPGPHRGAGRARRARASRR
jgi:ribosome biogenesis GTPase